MAQAVPAAALTPPPALEHDPEKWVPVFPRDKREAFARRSCSNKKIERDDDSKKSHPARVPPIGCREFVLGNSNRNGIRIIDLPVPSCLRSSCQKLLRRMTNFGSRAPGRFRRAMSRFVASASRPEVSWILPCAADFCLMSKPALPCKRDADGKHVGARRRAGEEAR
jgi:hypothetical protein